MTEQNDYVLKFGFPEGTNVENFQFLNGEDHDITYTVPCQLCGVRFGQHYCVRNPTIFTVNCTMTQHNPRRET